MKKNKINFIETLLITLLCCTTIISCQYDEIVSMEYPAQKIYLPAAANGIYTIDDVSAPISVPTSGNVYRFKIDRDNNAFNITLGAYRSGIENSGNVNVNLAINNDTINALIATGDLENVEILPSEEYSLPQIVTIPDGKDFGEFNLKINLDFLKANEPRKYGIALSIVNADREVNTELNTVVIVVDTKIMTPTSSFTYSSDANNWKTITFKNSSKYGMKYKWDFGDGETSTEQTPSHTYVQGGKYTVSLIVEGLTGELTDAYEQTISVYQIEKMNKSGWKIVDYDSEATNEDHSIYPNQGYVSSVIDDNLETFWHSQWSQPVPQFPHWFIVDLGQEKVIGKLVDYRRQGNSGGHTERQILVSLDGQNWEDMGTFARDPGTDEGQTINLNYPRTRYIKYVATQGPNAYTFLAELDVYVAIENEQQ